MVVDLLTNLVGFLRDLFLRLTGRDSLDLFEKVLMEGMQKNIAPGKTQQARDWFRSKAEELRLDPQDIFRIKERWTHAPRMGEMYMFQYFAKHHETLPYYDRLPCVIPIKTIPNGFVGINFHYLPLRARATLMDVLYSVASDTEMSDETKLNITYQMIDGLLRFDLARPCIKKYLYSQMQSRFVKINSSEWDIALFLPVEQFSKGKGLPSNSTKIQAQSDAMRKLGRRKV